LRCVVKYRDVSAANLGILLGPERHLAEQFDNRVEPGLRAVEGSASQAADEPEGLLKVWGGIEVWFVRALRVVLAQPALLRQCPLVEVGRRGARVAGRHLFVIEGEEEVVESAHEVGPGDGSDVFLDEHLTEEAEDERGVVSPQETPCCTRPECRLEVVVQRGYHDPVAITWSRSEMSRAVPDFQRAG